MKSLLALTSAIAVSLSSVLPAFAHHETAVVNPIIALQEQVKLFNSNPDLFVYKYLEFINTSEYSVQNTTGTFNFIPLLVYCTSTTVDCSNLDGTYPPYEFVEGVGIVLFNVEAEEYCGIPQKAMLPMSGYLDCSIEVTK